MRKLFDCIYENKIAVKCETPQEIESIFSMARESNICLSQDHLNYKICFVRLKTRKEIYRLNFSNISQMITGKNDFYDKTISLKEFLQIELV